MPRKAPSGEECFMAVDLIAGLGIFKSLYDSAKALKDINDATIRNGAIIELQEKILAAREAQTALLERISDLEKEVANFKTWDAEKQKYEMKVISPGSFVYALKEQIKGTEPPHYICANCYEDGNKSFLQRKPANPIGAQHFGEKDTYACPKCHSSVSQ
jgi:Zn finger protein HypA/HybF involved in hydrogenase expression